MNASDRLSERSAAVGGQVVWYRSLGTGIPLVVLPGWGGPTDKYRALLNQLAARGYSVVLPDLPGLPGKTTRVFIPLKSWVGWVEEFTDAAVGRPFVLVSHSLSARIALEYLANERARCVCSVFIAPWLVSSEVNALVARLVALMLRLLSPIIYPEMRWVYDRTAWRTAFCLFSAPKDPPRVPSVVVFGENDPARRLFGGWKRIGCEARVFQFGHSPQITNTSELAALIDQFVRTGR